MKLKNILLIALSFNSIYLPVQLLKEDSTNLRLIVTCLLTSITFALLVHLSLKYRDKRRREDESPKM